jgi:hypothetical protein
MEVGRYLNYNILPNHGQHIHVPWHEAVEMVQSDTHYMIGGDREGTLAGIGITPQASNDRVWKSRPSRGPGGAPQVMQLVAG